MTVRNLDYLFKPRSIALIGTPGDVESTGVPDRAGLARRLIRNLLNAGFSGPIMPVTDRLDALEGILTYPDIAALPETPDLAVIASPLTAVPALIQALAVRGTRAAVLVNSGDETPEKPERKTLKQAILDAARPHTFRIMGPGVLGLIVPDQGLNASLSSRMPKRGHLAFVTQWGGVAHAALDWAHANEAGFSHMVSLGAAIDVDFGDLLDYLAVDPDAQAILLYLERIRDARKFMSAARRAARIKPVLVLKARHLNRRPEDNDAVYEAAFRRAGILRVDDLDELFSAVEGLSRSNPIHRDRLAIISNSRSLALIAGDQHLKSGGSLAKFSDDTRTTVTKAMDPLGYCSNPLDLGDLAGAREYALALDAVLDDPGVDGVLAINVPSPTVNDPEVLEAVVARKPKHGRVLLASWVGPGIGRPGRQRLQQAKIPTYESPADAVRAFHRLIQYRRNQKLLTETPASIPEEFSVDLEAAREILRGALDAGRTALDESEALRLLSAFEIPVVESRLASDARRAAGEADALGGSVALKLISRDVDRKSDVGGVALQLEGGEAVEAEAQAMVSRLRSLAPEARVEGFLVQPMVSRADAFELTLGLCPGNQFGPVLYFGHGGTETEVIDDLAYGLPPMNMNLARELMSRTRIYQRLAATHFRHADLDHLALTLIQVAQIAVDLPEIAELRINPLWALSDHVVALDARVRIRPVTHAPGRNLAVRPYPKELEELLTLADGRDLLLRPILPEDEPALRAGVRRNPPEFLRMRFFQPIKELTHAMATPLTQIDYHREMALVLADPDKPPGEANVWAVVRITADPDNEKAEYAIIVDHSLTGLGLGPMLMRRIIDYAKDRGIKEIWGEVLRENQSMLKLNRALGFSVKAMPEDPGIMHVSLKLVS
jgi:acetyltransferase